MYSTTIGKLDLPHFIYNAAGVWDTSWSQCQELCNTPLCGATVTKSCTLHERDGNDYPKYHFYPLEYSINSNGLENFGLGYYLENLTPHRNHPIFYSIGGLSDDERFAMVMEVANKYSSTDPVGIELNLSCPNLGCPGAAYYPSQLDETLRKLFEVTGNIGLTFGLKLPPYYLPAEYENIANVLAKYLPNIDFITCINSIPNGVDFDIDNNTTCITPNGGYGGVGGPAVLPIGLANVRRFSKIFRENYIDIQVIGCGGISSGTDAYKYLLAGADAVQVGTHLWKNGIQVFDQITSEFSHIMSRKGYMTLNQIPRC